MRPGVGLIYIATNNKDGKRYVGQTTNFSKRINGHKNNRRNTYFSNALRKYGIGGFSIFKVCYAADSLDFWEKYWIGKLNSLHPYGYNLMTGGAAPRHSEETKKKISNRKKGILHHFFGKHFTEEHREKISKANKGRTHKPYPRSKEWDEKISVANTGKKHTEASKEKMSEWRSANYVGEGNPFFGKTHSEESRKKIGQFHKGKPWSENRRIAYEKTRVAVEV